MQFWVLIFTNISHWTIFHVLSWFAVYQTWKINALNQLPFLLSSINYYGNILKWYSILKSNKCLEAWHLVIICNLINELNVSEAVRFVVHKLTNQSAFNFHIIHWMLNYVLCGFKLIYIRVTYIEINQWLLLF